MKNKVIDFAASYYVFMGGFSFLVLHWNTLLIKKLTKVCCVFYTSRLCLFIVVGLGFIIVLVSRHTLLFIKLNYKSKFSFIRKCLTWFWVSISLYSWVWYSWICIKTWLASHLRWLVIKLEDGVLSNTLHNTSYPIRKERWCSYIPMPLTLFFFLTSYPIRKERWCFYIPMPQTFFFPSFYPFLIILMWIIKN